MKKKVQDDYKTYRKFVAGDRSTIYTKCFHNNYGIQVILHGKEADYEKFWGVPPKESMKEGSITIDVVLGNDIEPYHDLNYVNGEIERYTNVPEAHIPMYIEMIRKRPNEKFYLDSAGNPIGLIEHKLSEMILILSKFQRFRKTDDPREIKPHLEKLHKKANDICNWIIMLENYCKSKD